MSKQGLEVQRNYPLRKKCKEFFFGWLVYADQLELRATNEHCFYVGNF